MRNETRRQRYISKQVNARKFPIEVACVNFINEPNVGYVIRAAACFGASKVNVIGSLPGQHELQEISGTTNDFVDIQKFANPHVFLSYCRENNIKLISAELVPGAINLHNYRYPLNERTCIVVGNEQTGVPAEILCHSTAVEVPMPGVGWCLNTAATAHIMLYEYTRQASQFGQQ